MHLPCQKLRQLCGHRCHCYPVFPLPPCHGGLSIIHPLSRRCITALHGVSIGWPGLNSGTDDALGDFVVGAPRDSTMWWGGHVVWAHHGRCRPPMGSPIRHAKRMPSVSYTWGKLLCRGYTSNGSLPGLIYPSLFFATIETIAN